MPKAGWREYTIAIFLLIVGLTYLVLQLISLSRGENSTFKADSEVIQINRYALWNELRTYITIACCLAGGVLLMRYKKLGWILSLSMILLFTAIAIASMLSLFSLGVNDASTYLAVVGSIVMLSLLGLHLSLHRKFVLKKNDWIRVILLCTALGLFYFLLQ